MPTAQKRSNSRGGKPDKLMRDAIMVALQREAEKGGKTKKLYVIADKLVDKAMEGDIQAIKEICDRVDGRPPQSHEIQNDTNILALAVAQLATLTDDQINILAGIASSLANGAGESGSARTGKGKTVH